MELPRFQYITQAQENFDNLSWVHHLHEGGVEWIHLKVEEADFYREHPDAHFLAYLHEKADLLRSVCDALGMLFSVHDFVSVADFSGADGVHFEREIQQVDVAMDTMGKQCVIGATWNDAMKIVPGNIHYINVSFGKGPSKEKSELLRRWMSENPGLRFYASLENTADISECLAFGYYGIEASAFIFEEGHDVNKIREITNAFS